MTTIVELVILNLKKDFVDGFERKDLKWPAAEYGNIDNELKTITTSDFTRYFFYFPRSHMPSPPHLSSKLYIFVSSFDVCHKHQLSEGVNLV
ncbi:uncharacterized protein B0H18DRAFT_1208481 [Fomitopsis serialis]|uniref:uncharacterized protein n=1 Tax=Fomitopsis serialis TaxID=139415 RepID=UPI0020085900|nr:uncharacterized protein B0H18DRAFT_1208481 [Neoantrodia serialis]KAH9932611.1 hypothetical protein B0H18DRAFT_1208481 [Neoantrodia serialis]